MKRPFTVEMYERTMNFVDVLEQLKMISMNAFASAHGVMGQDHDQTWYIPEEQDDEQ